MTKNGKVRCVSWLSKDRRTGIDAKSHRVGALTMLEGAASWSSFGVEALPRGSSSSKRTPKQCLWRSGSIDCTNDTCSSKTITYSWVSWQSLLSKPETNSIPFITANRTSITLQETRMPFLTVPRMSGKLLDSHGNLFQMSIPWYWKIHLGMLMMALLCIFARVRISLVNHVNCGQLGKDYLENGMNIAMYATQFSGSREFMVKSKS